MVKRVWTRFMLWLHLGSNDEPMYLGNSRANLVNEAEARLKA